MLESGHTLTQDHTPLPQVAGISLHNDPASFPRITESSATLLQKPQKFTYHLLAAREPASS